VKRRRGLHVDQSQSSRERTSSPRDLALLEQVHLLCCVTFFFFPNLFYWIFDRHHNNDTVGIQRRKDGL